jgi:glutathione S-transferase
VTNRLVTIPFSHYCEKARWALDRAQVPYVEEMHLPVFHARPAMRASGQRKVPALVTDEGPIADSTRIVEWVDAKLPDARKLFPTDPSRHAEVSRWESRFDEDLGPHTRRWGYGQLLADSTLAVRLLTRHASRFEGAALRVVLPVAAVFMRRSAHLSPTGVARSLEKVREVFDEVSEAVADGRRYLVGDQFTAADLAFASLAAPALLPDGYAKWLGGRDEAPAAMRATIDELRATPAGRYAMNLYTHDR